MFAPTALFALLSSLTALPALAVHNHPHRSHHQVAADYEARRLQELEERLLPITATTTIYIEETRTQTIWVQPTDQVHYEPSGTGGAAPTSSAASAETSASSSEGASSAEASTTVSVEASTSAEVSPSETSPPSASASGSNAPSPLSASDSGSARSSPAPTASSSDAQSSLADAQASSSAVGSTSAEVSASVTSHHSASASGSNAPSRSRASGSGSGRSRPPPTGSASVSEVQSSLTDAEATSSEASYVSGSITSDYPSASITDVASSSRSRSNAPTYGRSSGSGGPRPTPTSSSYLSESSSAPETSLVVESASSSSSKSHQTLWSASSSAIISSVTANASANASSSYSSAGISSSSAVASSTSSASGSSSTLAPLGSRLMNGYYPDWAAYYLAPESVDWTKYDVMEFAFALPTQDGGLQFTQDDSSDLLRRLVASGHAAGKRVKLSIGGWTGSAYFSTICADDSLRATFVQSIVTAYNAYGVDGIDIDWEYPGTSGAAGNAVSPDDSANYLRLLQDMRAALPADALITTATQVWPFAGPDGNPLADVSAFAEVLDWILIMNYDIWGSSSTPGPNAPLSDACGNSTQPLANAYAAVSSWTTAGMPANKITLGVPAYGYLSGSWANSLVQRRSHFPQPPHKRALASKLQARGDVTVYNGNGGSSDGQVMFYSLLSQGALVPDGQGGYTGAGGFTRHWDSCSSTPWLKSDSAGQIITYDDAESMSLKGQFAAQAGIRGCNVFSVDGDFTNPGFPLTDAVRSGLGL